MSLGSNCSLQLAVRKNCQLRIGCLVYWKPGACFSKAPETFRARKAIFSSSVSKNGEVYRPETSCIKGTWVHIKNT